MAFTNGTLYGRLDGQHTGDVNNTAFNASNATNPNQQPKNDLFQILAIGGECLLRVSSAGVVTTNVAAGVQTAAAEVAQVQLTAGQMLGLGASPSAAQICAAAFPANYNNQQLDLFQISSDINNGGVAGGGAVVFRLKYDGSTATS